MIIVVCEKTMNRILRLLSIVTLSLSTTACAETLSSNLDANVFFTELVGGNTWIGAGFATGPSNYTLNSATLLLQQNATGGVLLDLYSDTNGRPGVLLGALGAPGGFSSTLTPTEFSGSNLPLLANNTYWLVLRSNSGEYEWAYTDNNTGSGVGFVGTWSASDDAGATWLASDIDPMMMAVEAVPANATVPEPGAFLLFAAGVLVLTVFHSFKRRSEKKASVAR
jgi:hypothetical protein